MTLKEALETGLDFKRSSHQAWTKNEKGQPYTFTTVELLADDWEVKQPEVTINYLQLRVAIDSAMDIINKEGENRFNGGFVNILADVLGIGVDNNNGMDRVE